MLYKQLIAICIGESIVAILKETTNKFQKGENAISCTYPNAKEATKAILKSLRD